MKTKLGILFFFFLFLTACTPTDMQIKISVYICSDKGGVYAIYNNSDPTVQCKNNTYHKLQGVVIPLEFLEKENEKT